MVKRRHRERLDDDTETPTTPPAKLPRQQTPRLTLLDAVADPNLFEPFFRDQDSWRAWFALIAAAFALPMTAEQFAIFQACTQRQSAPTQAVRELVLVIGRRGGKSRVLALIAVWLACFFDFKPYLSPGEKGVVQVLAADRRQARVILRYTKAFIAHVPMLARLIAGETQESVELSNGLVIEVATASFRSVRGRTVVAALCDEIAFWQSDDSANPDQEVVAAIRPSMATIPNSMLLLASSPYARRGVLYNAHKQHYGTDDDRVLVWQAATDVMNPAIDRAVIEQAYADDPTSACAEYGAQFRSDVESFISREAVDAVTPGERERPYLSQFKYHAFVDPSGGSGADSFTLALGHVEDGVATLDVIRERKPPFSPAEVVAEYAALLKAYNISKVTGDRFAGEWPREQFRSFEITYDPSAKPKSAIYSEFLPLLNSKKCSLLDHGKLITQLVSLERRTSRGNGREQIDHPPGGHDDVVNAAAGVLTTMGIRKYRYDSDLNWIGGDDDPAAFRAARRQAYIGSGGMRRFF